MARVDRGLFLRALAVQALAVGVLFAVLLALPLGGDFFRAYGFAIGPIAWALCSLVTAAVLSLPRGPALLAALAGGAGGFIAGRLLAGHTTGLVVALLVFAAFCGGYGAQRDGATA